MSDNYETDKWISDLFFDYYDPCPFNPIWTQGVDIDGLQSDWSRYPKIFINPPYSNPMPWALKAIETKQKNPNHIIVMLLKNDSSTRYYRALHEHGSEFLFPYGRLKFRSGKSAPFSSVLVIL